MALLKGTCRICQIRLVENPDHHARVCNECWTATKQNYAVKRTANITPMCGFCALHPAVVGPYCQECFRVDHQNAQVAAPGWSVVSSSDGTTTSSSLDDIFKKMGATVFRLPGESDADHRKRLEALYELAKVQRDGVEKVKVDRAAKAPWGSRTKEQKVVIQDLEVGKEKLDLLFDLVSVHDSTVYTIPDGGVLTMEMIEEAAEKMRNQFGRLGPILPSMFWRGF